MIFEVTMKSRKELCIPSSERKIKIMEGFSESNLICIWLQVKTYVLSEHKDCFKPTSPQKNKTEGIHKTSDSKEKKKERSTFVISFYSERERGAERNLFYDAD